MGDAPLEQAVPVGAPVLGHLRSASAAAARDEEGRAGKAFASGEIGRVLPLPASWLSHSFLWGAVERWPGAPRRQSWRRVDAAAGSGVLPNLRRADSSSGPGLKLAHLVVRPSGTMSSLGLWVFTETSTDKAQYGPSVTFHILLGSVRTTVLYMGRVLCGPDRDSSRAVTARAVRSEL